MFSFVITVAALSGKVLAIFFIRLRTFIFPILQLGKMTGRVDLSLTDKLGQKSYLGLTPLKWISAKRCDIASVLPKMNHKTRKY